MKRPRTGSTPKQYAYAVRKLNGEGGSKKEIARMVGFSPSVANNAANKIEKTVGYQNAVIDIAGKSNNLILAIMAEYQARGLNDFSNKDLNGALNAIAAAWEKFDKRRAPEQNQDPEKNPLKRVVLNRIENQTIINNPVPAREATASEEPSQPDEKPDLDF